VKASDERFRLDTVTVVTENVVDVVGVLFFRSNASAGTTNAADHTPAVMAESACMGPGITI
jgi:hypothetical protein